MNARYARLPDRVKAAFIDSVVLVILMYGITELFGMFDSVPKYMRAGSFVLVFFLYEPILVAFFGRTFGHLLCDLIVKKEQDKQKNIAFHHALIRIALKLTLGWLSLLTVTTNDKHQAIHDSAAKSVVISIK